MNRIPKIVVLALFIASALAVLHAAGARESTRVIAGIAGSGGEALAAILYIGAWFVTVLVAPCVLLAWGLLAQDEVLRPKRDREKR